MPIDRTDPELDSVAIGRDARLSSAALARITGVIEAVGPMHVRGRLHYCRHALGVARITSAQFVAEPDLLDPIGTAPAEGPEAREVRWLAEAKLRKAAWPGQWDEVADDFAAIVNASNRLAHAFAARHFDVALKWEKAVRMVADAWERLKETGVMVPEGFIPTFDAKARPKRQHNRAGLAGAGR